MNQHLRTLALVLEYDGTNYHGFQRQTSLPSVAERVETVLATLFGHEIKIVAAGRTDAGVHATGQVVSCTTSGAMPLRRIAVAASALLRRQAIAVLKAVERPEGFSARRDALSRTYRYRILNRLAPSPLYANRAFHVSAALDVAAMRSAAAALVGKHNFSAFCATESRRMRTTRTLLRNELLPDGDFLDLWMTADSFLHNMVRIAAGTLIEVGRGRRTVADVDALLRSGDRSRSGFTAPPHGLYLERVEYQDPIVG